MGLRSWPGGLSASGRPDRPGLDGAPHEEALCWWRALPGQSLGALEINHQSDGSSRIEDVQELPAQHRQPIKSLPCRQFVAGLPASRTWSLWYSPCCRAGGYGSWSWSWKTPYYGDPSRCARGAFGVYLLDVPDHDRKGEGILLQHLFPLSWLALLVELRHHPASSHPTGPNRTRLGSDQYRHRASTLLDANRLLLWRAGQRRRGNPKKKR